MKIAKITLAEYKPFIQNKKQNKSEQQNISTSNPFQTNYKNFNINFRGRTPENFYEQEFNIKYMPETMKKFLNTNYEERKHIPPEQIMKESFKYLAVTDNFADVKSIYPEETLFDNLHEANLKGRSGILSDIKLAKEMSETPLLKDGSDHLGIYLLRKVFLEGKTIKEINKDFYEKDLNPEYKGVITQPITYGTTSAYGIRYPKTDFWNSFIATREEYKKFFINLPEHSKTELKRELSNLAHKKTETEQEKVKPRKYTIKKYQKEHIKDDIIKAKGDEKAIKNAIVKRFKKDDPQAAFIVKYLSPIMTIAADRIHLSEELKEFADVTKSNGKKIENLFAQFWKARPELLEHYSTAITDTIELFEETYSSGGTIPINNEYSVITAAVENQKPIDFVPQRFAELLDYVQTIVPEREKVYALHNEEQLKWNEHFLWRYGEVPVPEDSNVQAAKLQEKAPERTNAPIEILKECAKDNNAKVYTLRGLNGETLHITANLDETLNDYMHKEFSGSPKKFINLVFHKALKNPLMTEMAKLSFATEQIADKLDDDRLLGKAERKYIMNLITSELTHELLAASMATLDMLASRSKEPERVYRTLQPNYTEEDIIEYQYLLSKYYNEQKTDAELNHLYDLYKQPLRSSEVIKITNIVMDYIRNFNPRFAITEKSVFYNNPEIIKEISSFQSKMNETFGELGKKYKQIIKQRFASEITKFYFGKSLLAKGITKEQATAKTEIFIFVLINSILESLGKNIKLYK